MIGATPIQRALLFLSAMLILLVANVGSAQAEAGANWKLNGANVAAALLPGIRVTLTENNSISLLTNIVGRAVKFACTSAQIVGAKLETEGKVTSGFKIKLTGCITVVNGFTILGCEPHSPGQAGGTVESNALKGLLVLHEGKGVIRVEPVAGENLKVYEVPEECELPEFIPLKGKLFLKDCKGELNVEISTHLLEEGPLTHMFVINDTAEHAAHIDGSIVVELTGAHAGLKWSGIPG